VREYVLSRFSFFFDVLPCSSALIPCAVAVLNAREALEEELQLKSIATRAFEVYNHNSFRVSREVAHGESDATEVPSSVWMKTIKGEKSADALRVARIQVDRKVVPVTAIRFCGDFGIRVWPLPFPRVSFSDLVHI